VEKVMRPYSDKVNKKSSPIMMSAFSPEKGGATAINPQKNRFLSETFFILLV
jgi:hypothetical protein